MKTMRYILVFLLFMGFGLGLVAAEKPGKEKKSKKPLPEYEFKRFYVDISVGYAFRLGANEIDGFLNTGMEDITMFDLFDCANVGKGVRVGANFGFNFNRYMGLELNGGYIAFPVDIVSTNRSGRVMISETMGDGYIDDLPQLPVYNDGDKIVFYAQGPVSWEYSGASKVRHERNPYSVAGYYFITENEGENVIQTTGEPSAGNGRPLITTTVATFLHENELYAPATTGRSLFGEDFRYNTVQTFPFSLPGRVENTAVSVRVNFFANTSGRSSLDVVAENETVASLSLSATTGSYSIGTMGSCSGNTVAGDDNLSLTLRYSSSGSISFAYLDYIELNYRKSLALSNGSVEFRSYSSECRDSVFSVAGCNDGVVVWDITDKHKPLSVETVMEGTELRFRQTETGRREYVAFNPAATFPAPSVDGAVENQNLHGAETPTMLILTPSEFISEAQRLANFHEEHDSMRVLVVDHKKVFNEFSSGTPDAMAYRKIAKMFWERTKNLPDSSNSKFRYMILFGRSLFDNRQLSAAAKSVTYPLLLTWESDNSVSQSDGFNSDDIFGTLEDGTDFSGKYENLDIA